LADGSVRRVKRVVSRERSFHELADVQVPAWPAVQKWIAEATNPVEVLQPAARRADELVAVQVTLHSTLGAIAYETGGLLVDHGWIRLLGSGHPRLPRTLATWNRGRTLDVEDNPPGFFLVGDDVVGGFFALDGGVWGTRHHVHYLSPDTLEWEDLDRGYTDFLCWCFSGGTAGFYEDYRWRGWQAEVGRLPGDRAYSIAPPPFITGAPLPKRSRRDVPVSELYSLYLDMQATPLMR